MVYYRILNIVACAIQWDLMVYSSSYNTLHLLIQSSQSIYPPISLEPTNLLMCGGLPAGKFLCLEIV